MVRKLALNEGWCLFGFSDLEHGVRMRLFSFALLTEVEVRAHTALVSDTCDRIGVAAIAGDAWMHLG